MEQAHGLKAGWECGGARTSSRSDRNETGASLQPGFSSKKHSEQGRTAGIMCGKTRFGTFVFPPFWSLNLKLRTELLKTNRKSCCLENSHFIGTF